ncbi:MAG: calcium/sodium antiporter [Nanoarchaeota archaeon]|nr:calcium/sodium antiporter [Nanoarchaeota archaeon]
MVAWAIVNFILGLVAIWFGANFVVESAVRIAKSLNLSRAFIGLTVLSVGTSLPEIFTHIFSSIDILKGLEASAVSVGTNIGSNMIQISFIIGILGLITIIRADKKILKMDYLIMLGAIAVLFIMALDGRIGQIEGVALVLAYIFYIWVLAKREHLVEVTEYKANYWKEGAIMIFGLVVLGIAANSVVMHALDISDAWGISASFIGVLIIGVSTALPEMTTALIAILKGEHGLSLGTLVGSNITNPLFALGIGAAISGYTIENTILWYDIPCWFFASILLLLFFWKKLHINKRQALVMILIYIAYGFFRIKLFI